MRTPRFVGPGGHQLARRTLIVAPSSDGIERPRETRTRSHSSTVSASNELHRAAGPQRRAARRFLAAVTNRLPATSTITPPPIAKPMPSHQATPMLAAMPAR